jgi:hypothetical protein
VRQERGLTGRRLSTERVSGRHTQGATLLVLLQPVPSSTRLPNPFPTAVLFVTFEGQDTTSPKFLLPKTVLSITVLPWPIVIPPRLSLTLLPVTVPVAEIANLAAGERPHPNTVLPLTIPLAAIASPAPGPETRNLRR